MGSLTTLYTDKAIDYLKEQRDPDKPFVLYLAHTMMHTIIDASERFRGKSAGGLYGDVVEEFDYETGRLLDTLDELGLSENTLVIYTSDNGPWNQPKYTDNKKGHPEGSIFWGEAGPLRNGKGSCYEGGYRLPCIVRWPGKVPAGRVSDAIFATIDFLPTFATLAGFKVPDDRRIDGIDQTDLLLGKRETGSRALLLQRRRRPPGQVEVPEGQRALPRLRGRGRPEEGRRTLRPRSRPRRADEPRRKVSGKGLRIESPDAVDRGTRQAGSGRQQTLTTIWTLATNMSFNQQSVFV